MSHLVNLPNALTFMRIVLIPIFVVLFYLSYPWAHGASAAVFALACFTDWLDGYLARKWHQTSPFGAFLDPVADKLAVSTALLLLVGEKDLNYITLPAIIIVGREIVISALREWMAEMGQRASVTVNFVGKFKTAIQMLALMLLIAFYPETSWLGKIGFVLLYVAAILTIWSMVVYLKMAWPELIKKKS